MLLECNYKLNFNVLLKAFIFIAIYAARVRPTFMRIRAGFRAWFDAKIAVARIQVIFGFTYLFCHLGQFTFTAKKCTMLLCFYFSIPSTFRLSYQLLC